jgi:hypothetical protein
LKCRTRKKSCIQKINLVRLTEVTQQRLCDQIYFLYTWFFSCLTDFYIGRDIGQLCFDQCIVCFLHENLICHTWCSLRYTRFHVCTYIGMCQLTSVNDDFTDVQMERGKYIIWYIIRNLNLHVSGSSSKRSLHCKEEGSGGDSGEEF